MSVKNVVTQTRPDVSSDLIWVRNVFKGYQQMEVADKMLNVHLVFGLRSLIPSLEC